MQWVEVGGEDVDAMIGANPSAEGGDGDEGVDSTKRKVVDLIDGFQLNVSWVLACAVHYSPAIVYDASYGL